MIVLILDETDRNEFKKPLGKLYPFFEDALPEIISSKFLISVGDETTNNLHSKNIYPNISIIDNLIQRKIHNNKIIHNNEFNNNENVLFTKNPPGTITDELWETIDLAIKKATNDDVKQLIVVEGEEDLAVLPCIVMAPDNAVVLYGQPNEGLVFLNVFEVKKRANELLKLFKKVDN
ncbi:GTP-dependent dephospho-CoA kinase family protein [Methanobrevibacter arboriphilus]|uniref:GTP-dependent dephospho-CoA kinase family protein n=1 Tax=Methanobrevibacter arboriphilus TaxID=39441 RepID=UPI00373AEF41